MQRLARHQAAVNHKEGDDGMNLKHGVGKHDSAGDRIVGPAARHPPGHQSVQGERGGDGRALKVGGLARGVFGYRGRGHVESCEAGQAAEDEKGETQVVEGGTDADCEGGSGGSDTEGNL